MQLLYLGLLLLSDIYYDKVFAKNAFDSVSVVHALVTLGDGMQIETTFYVL
jgi:hypothetical protein